MCDLKIKKKITISPSIEPLVESKPFGLIWSVNEVKDFGNHENKKISIFIWIHFFKAEFQSRTRFFILIYFKLLKRFLKSSISLTDQIKPSGFDSTSGSIDLIFSAPTYFEPNFKISITLIRFDQPCRQENDLLIFHFNMKNQKNFNYVLTIHQPLYIILICSESQITWDLSKI